MRKPLIHSHEQEAICKDAHRPVGQWEGSKTGLASKEEGPGGLGISPLPAGNKIRQYSWSRRKTSQAHLSSALKVFGSNHRQEQALLGSGLQEVLTAAGLREGPRGTRCISDV